jgi:hypothetical protein
MSVRIAGKTIEVNGRRVPLLSGEVHYWRLAPEMWRPILRRVAEMGIRVVASYVCWDFHEVAPGQWDFEGMGDPRRDLLTFLRLLAEEDFWVILRPGPYIYSEWRNGGVPDRVAGWHRLHPEFLAAAEEYMAAVAAAARPHLATNSGRILLWQADNEIDPWPHWYREQLGLGKRAGPFQDYLARRYGEIGALNEAWGTDYAGFEQARLSGLMAPEQPELWRRYLDFVRFRHDYVNEVARWAVGTYRRLGVDVPITLNGYSGVETQRLADLEAIGDLSGPDIYPSNEFRRWGNEHRNFLDAVRYTASYSQLPHIPEFQAGIWIDWLAGVGTLTPNHYRLACVSALMAGAVGWNWYMLVGRDNWVQAPINETAHARGELFATFQRMVAAYEAVKPYELERLAPVGVTYAPLQRSTTRPGQPLLEALYEADIDYVMVDVEPGVAGAEGDVGLETRPTSLLVYAGGPWLGRAAQARLLAYVEGGGHLLLVGNYPRYDEEMRPYNGLGIAEPDVRTRNVPGPARARLQLGDSSVVTGSDFFFHYERPPGEPLAATQLAPAAPEAEELALQWSLAAGERFTVGYSERRGAGRVTVVGVAPTPGLLLALLRWAGVSLPCRSETAGVNTALYRRGAELVLFVANRGEEEKTAAIVLDAALLAEGTYRARDLLGDRRLAAPLLAERRLYVTAPAKDGAIVRIWPER